MAKVYTHPHWETFVIDKSIYTPLERETLPLFRPIFFMRAAQGPAGVPVFCYTANEAKKTFGEATFDSTSEYFSREALYLNQLFTRQGAFIVRLLADNAKYASMVLEVRVKNIEVTQYQVDESGNFVLDEETGEKIPEVDSTTGAVVKEPGVELKWTVRPMDLESEHPESISNIQPTTYAAADGGYTVYPILAVKATSAGKALNNVGVKLFSNSEIVDDVLCEKTGSMQYQFAVVRKAYNSDTVNPVYSDVDNAIESFIAKPDQVDTRIDANVSFDAVIANRYEDLLPFETHFYADNVKVIGEAICEVESDDATLFENFGEDDVTALPYMVNVTDYLNVSGIPYKHVVVSDEEDGIILNSERILYLQGGTDGDIDDATIEELTIQYLQAVVYPEIVDQARYPFTHIIDTGVSLACKKAFIHFLGINDACKIILSTQDASMPRFNTKAEDLSAGSSLYASCLLQPESVEKGTECCRAEIYQQAGYLANSTYKGIIPATFDVMVKKSQYASTGTLTGVPAGLPASAINVFKSWSWTPCDADHKQKSWDSGLNYFQHYDMSSIHWPAMRSVYRYDTSVLSSAHFTDVIVYAKHLARYNWSVFAGVEYNFNILSERASSAIKSDLLGMLGGLYSFSVRFEQSDEEARIGYISHVVINIWGASQQRVWKIDIQCFRNGYNETSEENN